MPVTKPTGLPHNRGTRDSQHHKDRVRRQIVDHLKKNIGKEDIITGNGKVKIPVRGSKQYEFILDRGKGGQQSRGAGTESGEEMYEVWLDMEEVEEYLFAELDLPRLKPKREMEPNASDFKFDSYAIKGPQVDKKATLRRILARNAAQGDPGLHTIKKDDLRYVSFRDNPKPKTKAVVFLAMDVSGSMLDFHKQLARLFFFWIVRFLRSKYDTVEVKFIAHTTEAHEVTEHQFFNRIESGGTIASSAYKLVHEMQQRSYPSADWNIYVLHASDGDNWQLDNEEVRDCIITLNKVASLVGYLEIKKAGLGGWAAMGSTLSDHLKKYASLLGPGFVGTEVRNTAEVWPAIKKFFAKDQVEEYVA